MAYKFNPFTGNFDEVPTGTSGSPAWGDITGTLGDQTDLQSALNGKANTSHSHAISDVTNLQTALDGKANALGADDNYVTDAEKTALHSHSNKAVLDATTASFTTADETKLDGIASGAEVNVNADWNAVSGDAQILNKPTIPTVSDTAYGAGWDGDTTTAPSKNAVYDKIQTMGGGVSMGDVYPVGSVYIAVVSTNPATLLGIGTWSAFGTGRTLVGIDTGDTDFDTVEETGGAKTKAISAHTGTAVADHASHTHTYTEVPNHVHPFTINSSTTDGTWASFDSSTTAGTARNFNTANNTGGVATATTNGPNATLTHSVTQPSAHTDLNVVQPYITVYMWKRTA